MKTSADWFAARKLAVAPLPVTVDAAPVAEALAAGTFRKVVGRSVVSEILPAGPYFLAEAYHQQYLAKNPNGYCGIKGTGVSCPIGVGS